MPGARDLGQYWQLLMEGREGIRRLSDAQLRAAGVGEERLRDPALIRALGLLEDSEYFDAGLFGYSASDAEILDPQQRLFLEQAWMALESAGYAPEKFAGGIGLFAGSGFSAYTMRLLASGWLARAQIGFQKIIGNDKDHLTTAAAYKLGLTGPAVTVQTTCSTSLVAVHLACRSLLGGECDMALAGAVTAGLEPATPLTYQEGNILAADGRCRPFDALAAGTVASNGVGVVVLRRLDDALRDGDNIRAVIRASAVNNDGSLKVGYLSPSVSGQYKVIRKALRLADVHPDSIDYVEAHGTGTLKGDPIEFEALTRAFRDQTARRQYCALGSVKGNIGHPDTAAGMAGLIKAILAMQHGWIPPTLHFSTPNPELDLGGSPFYINSVPVPWPAAERPRRAAVSSFGLGGTNAHLVLEQAPAPTMPVPPADEDPQLMVLSANSKTALTAARKRLGEYLRRHDGAALRDIAFTLRHGRTDLKERAFFVGNRAELIGQLEAVSAPAPDSEASTRRPALFIDGASSAWCQLVQGYYRHSAVFRDWTAADAQTFSAAGLTIDMLVPTWPTPAAGFRQDSSVWRFAAGYLLGGFILRLGIALQAIVAFGADELIAACLAGVCTLEDGLKIARLLDEPPASTPLETKLEALLSTMTLATPRIAYFSQCSGRWCTAEQVTQAAYWRAWIKQVRGGRRFEPDAATIAALHAVHIDPVHASEDGALQLWRATDTVQEHYQQLLRIVGELWRLGQVPPRPPAAVYGEGRRIELPPYPFERKRYWIDTSEGHPTTTESEARSSASNDVESWFQLPVWRQHVASPVAVDSCGTNYFLLAAAGDVLAESLASSLMQGGASVVRVHHRQVPAGMDGALALDGCRRDSYARLLQDHEFSRAGTNRFVFFDSYFVQLAGEWPSEGPSPWFCVPMWLAQALGEKLLGGGAIPAGAGVSASMIVVSNGMWSVDGEEACFAEKALARGLGKVLAQEYPGLIFKSVDLPAQSATAFAHGAKAQMLLDELLGDASTAEVALRGRLRWQRVFEPVRISATDGLLLRHRGVYLITGGLGGIGLEIAEYLARQMQAKLVLISRNLGADDRLQRLREQGAELLVLQADVTDGEAMLRARLAAEERFGAINGVIHAAGSLPTTIVQRMSEVSAWEGLRAKVKGTEVICALFADRPPDFVLLFSSLRAIIGGAGNGDYAAANAFMDAYANEAWASGRTYVRSINWDGWAGVGMSARVKQPAGSPADPAPLAVADGLRAWVLALSIEQPQVLVSPSNVNDLAASMAATNGPSPLDWLPAESRRSTAGQRPEHLDSAYAPARNETEARMVDIWEQYLGVSPIGVTDSFVMLGGDSVTSLQIAAKATERGLRIGPFAAMESGTIDALCASLDKSAPSRSAMDDAEVTGDLPLTPIQLWFFEQALPQVQHFNQAFLLKTTQRLDAGRMNEAMLGLLKQHDALRTRFFQRDGHWQQQLLPYAPRIVLEVEDLSDCTPEHYQGRLSAVCARVQVALDLDQGLLIKAVFFDSGDADNDRLMICAHHLVVDAISWRILLEDLHTGYEQLARGEPLRLASKSTSYKQWAESLRAYADALPVAAVRDAWLRMLSADHNVLPRDFPDGRNTVASAATLSRELTLDEAHLFARAGVSPFALFLAALGTAFADWMGPGSTLVALEGHGRDGIAPDMDLSRTVGWFTALYPFAIPRPSSSAQVHAIAVQEALNEASSRGLDYGVLAYLCDDLIRYGNQPEALVLYLGQGGQKPSAGKGFELAVESPGWTQDPVNERSHVLEIVAGMADARLSIGVTFSKALHKASTIELFLQRFEHAYMACAKAAAASLSQPVDSVQ
ncbi:hypothetical protein GCM10007898_14850 [Dyella flagellata]|uniref:Uncharacterized protein n=2 Tax=Dyella flagellata TaxID=1867833 RepID=A0ABQ5XAJ3_9GAMM|nr:hypothetical protein GCM10007898_14850 [Dyella flagellata]